MGRLTDKLTDFLDEQALRDYVTRLPREDYLAYLNEHPEFRSSNAQSHSDLEMLTMRAVEEAFGEEAADSWALKRYWQNQTNVWRAEQIAHSHTRLEAAGLTFIFNAGKYGTVLGLTWLCLPPVFAATFSVVFSVIVVTFTIFGALLRKVI